MLLLIISYAKDVKGKKAKRARAQGPTESTTQPTALSKPKQAGRGKDNYVHHHHHHVVVHVKGRNTNVGALAVVHEQSKNNNMLRQPKA